MVVPAEGVEPPRYEYARKNIWPSYLPKPKRQSKDDVPTCNCWPSQACSQGLRLSSLPARMCSASKHPIAGMQSGFYLLPVAKPNT